MMKSDWFVPVDRNILTTISNISGANPNKGNPKGFEIKKSSKRFIYVCFYILCLDAFPFLVHSSVVR